MNNHNRHSLVEITRRNILGKNKAQTPLRYAKRLSYRAKGYTLDTKDLLKDDRLVAKVAVGDYICTIEYVGVLATLKEVLKHTPVINLQSVIRAVTRSFDNPDVNIMCSCPDFKYRFAYVASKFGYKYGDKERRPAKITNPYNRGSCCKHLAAVLSNKSWLVKVSSEVNRFIKSHYEDVLDKLGLTPEEAQIYDTGKHKPRSYMTKKSNGLPAKSSTDSNEEDTK